MHDKSTRECTIEEYLVMCADIYGGKALKLRPPTGRGFPDRTLTLQDAWVAFVEVKRPTGGKVAIQQKKWRDDLKSTGQRHYLVSTFAEVDTIFEDYNRRIKCQVTH